MKNSKKKKNSKEKKNEKLKRLKGTNKVARLVRFYSKLDQVFWAVNASAHCFSNPHILFTVQHNHIYVFTEAPFSSLGYSRYELLKTILFFSTPKLRNIRQ